MTGNKLLLVTAISMALTACLDEVPAEKTITIEERERGFCGVDDGGSIDTEHPGFVGTGYVNTANVDGASIYWNVTVTHTGMYNLVLRYSNGDEYPRDGWFIVNGEKREYVSMPHTGRWSWDWQTYKYSDVTPLYLEAYTYNYSKPHSRTRHTSTHGGTSLGANLYTDCCPHCSHGHANSSAYSNTNAYPHSRAHHGAKVRRRCCAHGRLINPQPVKSGAIGLCTVGCERLRRYLSRRVFNSRRQVR